MNANIHFICDVGIEKTSYSMNTTLWIVQGLLAAAFLMAGSIKLLKPKSELKPQLGDWVDSLSEPVFKIIGVLEVLGAIGLILPMAIQILPVLTPIAAIGLAMTMLGAMILHFQRNEKEDAINKNMPLLLLALFVTVGRFFILPIT